LKTQNGTAARRVGLLDLNNGVPNLGIRSILDMVKRFAASPGSPDVEVDVFDIRGKEETPNMQYDAFISSGGPGSPFDGEGSQWEGKYFRWLEQAHASGIPTLFICHSFELMIRHFGLAEVVERRSPAFGIFPVHPTSAGRRDEIFTGMDDPFYAADFRHWQVIEADRKRFKELGATILAREKIRDHVPLERAIMAVRVGSNMLGVQFHPEASPEGMAVYFQKDERMKHIAKTYGTRTLKKMLMLLEEPDALAETHATILPRFLHHALTAA